MILNAKKYQTVKSFWMRNQSERTFFVQKFMRMEEWSDEEMPDPGADGYRKYCWMEKSYQKGIRIMKLKRKIRRMMAFALALVMLCGGIPTNTMVADAAATAAVKLSSLGRKGTVTIGSKTKSGTWWQMNLNGKKAFCIDLGYTCHTGNTYVAEETHQWDQDTSGKNGCYAKIIRWYVITKKRSQKAFVMSQALIWSVAEGRNSESQLKDVISQVKANIKLSSDKSAADIYQDIFNPSGEWTAQITFWQKTGNSKSYQKLLTVDADKDDLDYEPESVSDHTYYRQRITVMKKDEDGKGLGGIQFTLDADNLDDLYSFSMTDRDGTEFSDGDDDNDTSFSLTGHTLDSGRIAFRMTYKLETMEYYYYPDSELEKMSADEKKKAKKYLTDELELDEGVDFASDMTKESARKLMNQEMKELKSDISNTYTLTEDNTGDNKDIILDPNFAKGVKITLNKANSWEKNDDGVWPDSLEEVASDYSKAYITGVTNKYKKASIKVVKIDKFSNDKKAHGEADLDGAQFEIYADASCTNKATVYYEDGTVKEGGAGVYTVVNGFLETDYLRSGSTYYLKEVKAPTGYTLSNDVLPIAVDASGVDAEYTKDIATVEYGNKPILGKVAIQKYFSEGQTGLLNYEANSTFQVYLTDKHSYDACDDYERDTITTDDKGYAITHDLYYGEYTVHQVDSGDVDVALVEDFQVWVTEDGAVYTYPMDNLIFKAYLRVIKKDGNTEKQVLKPGTTYQIYKVTDDGEKLVEQTYSNGNRQETISQFVTDETGEIMTVKELKSGTYRIYETDCASGLHITEKYIEVTINSKADNYESYTDEDGYTHAIVTVTYTNAETYGKLKVYKTGEMLTGFADGKFVYENRFLKGVVFEVYAAEDIVTQDNQGTNWYDKGNLVTTITTGEGAEFTKDCKNITGYTVDEDGTVTVNLPLGKYHVVEKQTLYGYVLPDAGWDVEFNWNNKDEEYVLNATDTTDKNGVLRVENARAKTAVSLFKADAATRQAVSGAVFGIYTKNDIFNVDGERIVEAGTMLGTVTTDSEGKAVADIDFPLMSEGYTAAKNETPGTELSAVAGNPLTFMTARKELFDLLEDREEEVSGEDTEEADTNAVAKTALNSGDYYLKELSVSDSYYLNETEYPVHLEYKDQNTKVIAAAVEAANTQTTTTISKTSVTGSGEVPGCGLQIADAEGNVIVSWVSDSADSIAVNDKLAEMGYCNVTADVNEDGSLNINGLFHDTTYILTETRPADGYVTADSISFQLIEEEDSRTLVAIVQGDEMIMQEDNIVRMVDDTTKIRLIKLAGDTGEGMRGAKFEVYDSEGNKVMSFTSKEDGYDITGKLAVGETYTFKETEAPKGYQLAKPVKYTVKDTGKVQKISITDKKTPKPHVPQTGGTTPFVPAVILLFALGCGGILIVRRKRVR